MTEMVAGIQHAAEEGERLMAHPIRIKRCYEPASPADGDRFLVDRLWPRGIRKQALHATWLKKVAPSQELRQWFGHDPARWAEFRKRYRMELENNPTAWAPLLEAGAHGTVTLLFSAHDSDRNNAVVLKEFLEGRSRTTPPKG